jgi:hypothetical protein
MVLRFLVQKVQVGLNLMVIVVLLSLVDIRQKRMMVFWAKELALIYKLELLILAAGVLFIMVLTL